MERTALDHTTRLLSESLARALNRRTFLKRAGQATFGVVATLAAGHSLTERAAAQRVGPGVDPMTPQCSPPGPYCNLDGQNNPNGCHGAHCFQHRYNNQVLQCHVYYAYYPVGCWTTTSTGGGYWTCCDCQCTGGPTCGCAQLTLAPVPLPDGPGAAKN